MPSSGETTIAFVGILIDVVGGGQNAALCESANMNFC